VIQKFIVKHSKGINTFFAEDELDAFKMAVARNAEDVEEVTDVSTHREKHRVSRKWIVEPNRRD